MNHINTNSIVKWLTHVIKTEVEPCAIRYINCESKKNKMTTFWDALDIYNHIKNVDFSKCTESEIRYYVRREFKYFNYANESDWYKIFKAQKNKVRTKYDNLQLYEGLVPLKMVDGIRRGK